MTFAPKKLEWRAAPTYGPGAPLTSGPLGGGQSVTKNHRDAENLIIQRRQEEEMAKQQAHRAPPQLQRPMHVRAPPSGPGIGRPLPASVDVREMAYRVQRELERMLLDGTGFIKFEGCLPHAGEPAERLSVEDRMTRAVELAARLVWPGRSTAPLTMDPDGTANPHAAAVDQTPFLNPNKHFSYFAGLKSQQPKSKSHIYFIKVDAACNDYARTSTRASPLRWNVLYAAACEFAPSLTLSDVL